ncbi:synaptotagmin-9 [Nilaparvata lugens]|uniref:synaptotagmin-9 n=1 Tax=Nilaparvata lugens TaxID=108931 RepID=UPI00193DF183|nr:synaptotagmin-9 [Nilaparvata lugens]
MILLLQLGVWGKLLVIAIGGIIVVVSVLIAACFLGPGCLGYNYLYRNQLKMKKKAPGVTFGGDFLLSEIGSSSVVTIHNINNSFRKTPVSYRQSVCSTISETSLTSGSNTSYTSIGFMPLPTIVFLLQNVTNPGKLIIFLKHLEGLPAKDFPHHTEVITELKIKSGTSYHWSAISRAIRNTRSPEYDTEFSLPTTTADLQKWCLTITAYDKDRFNGYRELATMDVFLRDFIPALQTGKIIRHASVMTVYKKEYGHLLIGLSYLPTAQRLTISLIRAANLVCLQNTSSEKDFRPLARVFLLDGTGKVIQREKSGRTWNTGSCPEMFFQTQSSPCK